MTTHASGPASPSIEVTRVADDQWQALEGDRVVGTGDLAPGRRPGLRQHRRLATTPPSTGSPARLPAALPTPLHTVVDEDDTTSSPGGGRPASRRGRREGEYVVPTDPGVTDSVPRPCPRASRSCRSARAQGGPAARSRPGGPGRGGAPRAAGTPCPPRWCRCRPGSPSSTRRSTPSPSSTAGTSGCFRIAPVPRRPRIGLLAVRAGRAAPRHRPGPARRGPSARCTPPGSRAPWAEAQGVQPGRAVPAGGGRCPTGRRQRRVGAIDNHGTRGEAGIELEGVVVE